MAEATKAKFACGSCGAKYTWKAELAGRKVQCRCGQVMIAPEVPPGGAIAAPRPAKAPSPAPARPAPARAAAEASPAFDDIDEADDGAAEDESAPMPARPGQAAGTTRRRASAGSSESSGSADTWKWWYYIVAGALIGAYSIFEIISGSNLIRVGRRGTGPIGGLIIAALCICVGIWSRPKSK
jgi:hypothetical protein